jgi:hypothetical protein
MFAVILAAFVLADPSPEPVPAAPTGPGPMLLNVQILDGKLVSKQEATVLVPVTTTEKVNVNGRIQVRTVTAYRTEKRVSTREWDLKKATFRDAGGKKIDLDTATRLLARPRPVAMSADGKAIDPGWLKVLKKDTLVIVAPQAAPANPPPPLPPPR